jgi:hypothetical protein
MADRIERVGVAISGRLLIVERAAAGCKTVLIHLMARKASVLPNPSARYADCRDCGLPALGQF